MNSGRDSDGDKFFSDLGGLVVFGDREPSEVAVPRLNEQDDDRKLAVEIARYPPQAPGEGFIESVGWREGHVEVDVLLADGRDAMARLRRPSGIGWSARRRHRPRALQRAMLSA